MRFQVVGLQAERALADALGASDIPHMAVGDGVAPRRLHDALLEATRAARDV
jgi:hypothetical protein